MLPNATGPANPRHCDQSVAVEIPDHVPGATVAQLGIEHGFVAAVVRSVRAMQQGPPARG